MKNNIVDLTKITECGECPRFRKDKCYFKNQTDYYEHLCPQMLIKKSDAIEMKFIWNSKLQNSLTKKGIMSICERRESK